MTGIGQVTTNFLKELVELRISNDEFRNETPNSKLQFILYCQEEPQLDFELPPNFEVRVFLPWWKRDDTIRQWLWERQLAGEAVKDGCDVFFSLYQSTTTFKQFPISNFQFQKTVKHVMLVHDLIPKLFPEYLRKWTSRFHYRALLKAIGRADSLLTPSEATKADLIRELGLEAQRIMPLSLGVDEHLKIKLGEEMLTATLNTYGLVPGYLYHGGGLERRKNTETVLRAYALFIQENFPNLPPLVISGQVHAETNPLATPVQKIIQELGLHDRVKLLGVVPGEDLPALYQGAAAFLFPSRYEGFGLPVLEAYASGTPVITTRAGALAELTAHDEALIVTDGGSSKELALAIEHILSDTAWAHRLGERGRDRAQTARWSDFTRQALGTLLQ